MNLAQPTSAEGNDKDVPAAANENIDTIANIYDWQEQHLSRSQLFIEQASLFFGSPAYLTGTLAFIACWIAGNLLITHPIDPSPFSLLQGIITFKGFLITVAVLIRQNRMEKMAERQAHLDLQVNLMTDEKVSKILGLMEQLRYDLTGTDHAADPEIAELKHPTDAGAMLKAIVTKHDHRQM